MRTLAILFVAIALVASGALMYAVGANPPTRPTLPPAASNAAAIPSCDDIASLSAPAESYSGRNANVNDEEGATRLQNWARSKPGFEELWIDRAGHNGWITLAFSRDAAAHQAEIRQQFPEVAAVVVAVDWRLADLMALQRRVVEFLSATVQGMGSGIYPNKGVVSIELPYLIPEYVVLAEQEFGGQRVCLRGGNPADEPAQGPQPTGGQDWRLLADRDDTGAAYRTGIAYDPTSYSDLWARAGLDGAPPTVDFETEVAIWFGAVHGSSCPHLRLDDVIVDIERSIVHARITHLDAAVVCTADALPHAYVIALERSSLPDGPFWIQLGASDPPAGVPEERTIVNADLSQPGSVAEPAEIRGGAR